MSGAASSSGSCPGACHRKWANERVSQRIGYETVGFDVAVVIYGVLNTLFNNGNIGFPNILARRKDQVRQ